MNISMEIVNVGHNVPIVRKSYVLGMTLIGKVLDKAVFRGIEEVDVDIEMESGDKVYIQNFIEAVCIFVVLMP